MSEFAMDSNASTQPNRSLGQPVTMSDILNSTFNRTQDAPSQQNTPNQSPYSDIWKPPPIVQTLPPEGGQAAPPGTPGNAADTANNPAKPTDHKPSPPKFDISPNDTSESHTSKIAREGLVLGGGLGRSVLYGFASLPERLPEIGESMAIGAALSTVAKSGTMGATASLIVGAYFTSKFIINAINDKPRWDRFGDAVTDAWHSNKNTMRDLRAVSDTGGNFAFDTGLSMTSGYVGYKNKALGDLILSVIKLPVPVPIPGEVPLPLPLGPALMGASMYMDLIPAPFLYKPSTRDQSFRDSDNDNKDKTEN